MMKVLLVATDNREHRGLYDMPEPWLSSPVLSLVDGFKHFPDEIEVHVASCAKRAMNAPEKLASNIYFHQPIVPKPGWGRSLFLGCALAIRKLARRIGVDLVHGQGSERDCAMTAACSGKPALITIHGHMGKIAEFNKSGFGSYYWMISRLEKWAVRHSDGVICLNSYTEQSFANDAARTWIVPNAVEKEFFVDRNPPATGSRGICVANISPWKNQVALIDACRQLLDSGVCELVFAGSLPPEHPYTAEFEARLRDVPRIHHLGFLTGSQIRTETDQCGFLVLPSLQENCPMAILEAMAAGVPVAAANVGGVPDLIHDGETGLLFDPRNPDDIRRQVGSLAANAELRRRLGENAKREALRRFHPRVVARAHIDIYDQLVHA